MSLKLQKSSTKEPFYLRWSYSYLKKRTRFSPGVKIYNKDFNPNDSNNPVKKSNPEHKILNKKVQNTYHKIYSLIRRFELENLEPYPELIKSQFHKKAGNKIKNELISDLINEYLSKQNIAQATQKNYLHVKRNLRDFNKDLRINELDNYFWDDFTNYLFSQNLANNTVNLRLTKFKTFLNKISEWGYQHKITGFKKPKEDINNIYLDKDELEKLQTYQPTSKREEITKDKMIIQCFTAYRISDLKRISAENKILKGNLYIIRMNAIKNFNKTYIPLRNNCVKILKKYEWKLPTISDQKYNKNIKQLLKNAGITREVEIKRNMGGKREIIKTPINEVFSSHDCVKTGISYYLNKGFSPAEVAGMTGKNIDTIMKYYYPNATESDILAKFKKVF